MFAKRYIDSLERQTVVLQLAEGTSLRGVLIGAYVDSLVLTHATTFSAEGREMPIDGEAIVPRAQVIWLQRLNGSTP